MTRPYNVLDIACFVVNKHNELYPDKGITNLRLQKLLYFIQCYFYLNYSEPCFKEDMEAWNFGPVSREVYQEFCIYGGENIESTHSYLMVDTEKGIIKKANFDENCITNEDKKLIESVINDSVNISSYDLVEQTHSQSPWLNNYVEGKKNKIPNYDISEFIKELKKKG